MQVYRGLDLGTAKPAAADRARIAHHLLDVVGLEEAFNAARWLDLARAALDDIHGRDRIAIVCGGTGLYFRALLRGLDPTPTPDPILRAELERRPLPELLGELAERDPAEFATIDRTNPRRVIRALEVIRLTGRPFSAQKTGAPGASPPLVPGVVVLRRDPADLRQRIERRVDRMFREGLVDETRELLELGLEENRTALQALGYRQVVEHLRGHRDLGSTIALVKQKTWQFARRQMTWWRSWPALWMDVAADEPADVTAAAIEQIWRRALGQ